MGAKGGEEVGLPLFEAKLARGGAFHKVFCLTMIVGIVLIWAYRLMHIPGAGEPGRYAWIGMFFAEVVYGLYWIICQSGRWHVVYRYPFKDRLSASYEDKLPLVDVFVCTADPTMEPPSLVINTILSVMSYNYPADKLSIYLSDDGGSELTFNGILEASKFAKCWIPFCKKYNVEPRNPEQYFSKSSITEMDESSFGREWTNAKKLYEVMKNRVDSIAAKGSVPQEIRDQHRGFSEWSSKVTKQDHQSIVQILIDGWNPEAVDDKGDRLPTLIYVSREKRPEWHHNFKAGSMNALLRVSGEISNAPIILNVDCDMYVNDPDGIRDALCFFLDKKHGQQTCYVQHPQYYYNTVKDDVYANVNLAVNSIELCGLDGHGGALYIGTGCFHRRESLSGKKYSGSHRIEYHNVSDIIKGRTIEELEDTSKALATCSYEKGTPWGTEMGLVYGCPVEDICTGLKIQCRGWRPVYYDPAKQGFLGIAPTNLDVSLIQYKRWSEGMFQIFLSKYCPFIYGRGKLSLGAQMGYCIYLLWPPLSFPTLCYAIIPAISLIRGTPMFPKVSTLWFLPFACFIAAKIACTLAEDVILGGTLRGWWNLQRMCFIRRTTAMFFALVDTIIGQLGLSKTSFVLTAKVVDDEARRRYEKGMIEFGSPSVTSTIIATLALLNLFSLGCGMFLRTADLLWEKMLLPELAICGAIVMLNIPVYEALFWRSDNGRLPASVAFKATVVASIASIIATC